MTVDLDTGIDRPPSRLDYCTKQTAVSPAPMGTPCPMWSAFLNRVTGNNDALIGFLQRFLGYCLTGCVHEHKLVFLYGTGANGKSVFVRTVAGILSDYAVGAPIEMFLTAKFDRHPTEIARLKGARLVVAQETQKNRAWDEAKLKNLTGGDRLSARFMRGTSSTSPRRTSCSLLATPSRACATSMKESGAASCLSRSPCASRRLSATPNCGKAQGRLAGDSDLDDRWLSRMAARRARRPHHRP